MESPEANGQPPLADLKKALARVIEGQDAVIDSLLVGRFRESSSRRI